MVYGERAPGGTTPKRRRAGAMILGTDSANAPANVPRGEAGAPSRQHPRTDFRKAHDVGYEEFLARHQFPVLATSGSVLVTDRDLQRALLVPTAGQPRVCNSLSDGTHHSIRGPPGLRRRLPGSVSDQNLCSLGS